MEADWGASDLHAKGLGCVRMIAAASSLVNRKLTCTGIVLASVWHSKSLRSVKALSLKKAGNR